MIGFGKAALPLRACSFPKDLSAEASEAHAVTENLHTTCAGVLGFASEQPKAIFLSPLWFSET